MLILSCHCSWPIAKPFLRIYSVIDGILMLKPTKVDIILGYVYYKAIAIDSVFLYLRRLFFFQINFQVFSSLENLITIVFYFQVTSYFIKKFEIKFQSLLKRSNVQTDPELLGTLEFFFKHFKIHYCLSSSWVLFKVIIMKLIKYLMILLVDWIVKCFCFFKNQ